jgi:hypothetical protein
MVGKIEFHGNSPFDLPTSRSSHADRAGDDVVLSFTAEVQVPRGETREVTVRTTVSINQARELAAAISRALSTPG